MLIFLIFFLNWLNVNSSKNLWFKIKMEKMRYSQYVILGNFIMTLHLESNWIFSEIFMRWPEIMIFWETNYRSNGVRWNAIIMLSITVMQESISFLRPFSRYSQEIALTVPLLAFNECTSCISHLLL